MAQQYISYGTAVETEEEEEEEKVYLGRMYVCMCVVCVYIQHVLGMEYGTIQYSEIQRYHTYIHACRYIHSFKTGLGTVM